MELVVAAVILVLSVVLVHKAWVIRRRGELRGSITEAQARENAAPLSTPCSLPIGASALVARDAADEDTRRRDLIAPRT